MGKICLQGKTVYPKGRPVCPFREVYQLKNRKSALFAPLFLLLAAGVFAQEAEGGAKKAALGLGPEWNMNARVNFAAGAVLGFDVNLSASFALGLTVTASNNFSGITVIEPAALFRWYVLGGYGGFFVQADGGAYLILEDGGLTPLFDGGLRAGFRLPLAKSFYLEPYGRMGYPFVFGIGALAGIRF